MKNKTRPSYTFIVCVLIQCLAGIVSIFTMIMCVTYADLSPLCYLIPAIFVDASATTAVVLHKRKSENVIAFLKDKQFKQTVEYFTQQGIDINDLLRALKE